MATPLSMISQPAVQGEFAGVLGPAQLGLILSPGHNEPPFPCIDCIKEFPRRSEWIRHGSDVHQPELKRVCPHANCERLFAPGRLYRMMDHYTEAHDGQPGQPVNGYPVNPFIEKIWACGFCVRCFDSWKDLGNHVWAHFKAGFQKQDWNSSIYIHSLVQHSAIHKHWQRLLESHGIEDEKAIHGLGWTDDDCQELRQQLEWDGPHRLAGDGLAKKAFDTLIWPQLSSSGLGQWNVLITTGPSGAPGCAPDILNFNAMTENDDPSSAGASSFAATPASPFTADQSPAQANGSLDADLDLQFLLNYDFEQDLGLD